ncbi:MAG: HAD family hydrolase [Chitinophagaceae bacterium]
MKKETIKLVVCDMAGTTVKDEHEVESCFVKAATSTRLKMTEEEILSVQGWSKKHVFEVFWERQLGKRDEEWFDQVEHSYAVFTDILENHYLDNPVYPTTGCLELFHFLNKQNIPIALTTGFYRRVTDIILKKLGWSEGLNDQHIGTRSTVIQASIASDEVTHGRPLPEMILKAMNLLGINDSRHVINIGDTPSDIQSGFSAGCLYSCCVTNGTHTEDQLLKHRPDKYFASMHDFKKWLSKHT